MRKKTILILLGVLLSTISAGALARQELEERPAPAPMEQREDLQPPEQPMPGSYQPMERNKPRALEALGLLQMNLEERGVDWRSVEVLLVEQQVVSGFNVRVTFLLDEEEYRAVAHFPLEGDTVLRLPEFQP